MNISERIQAHAEKALRFFVNRDCLSTSRGAMSGWSLAGTLTVLSVAAAGTAATAVATVPLLATAGIAGLVAAGSHMLSRSPLGEYVHDRQRAPAPIMSLGFGSGSSASAVVQQEKKAHDSRLHEFERAIGALPPEAIPKIAEAMASARGNDGLRKAMETICNDKLHCANASMSPA